MIRIIQCRKGKDRMENAVMKKKAVIFDMDGVLIDSEPVYLQLFRDLLRENGCVIDEEKMRVLAGASGSRLWGTVAQMWKEKVTPEEMRRIYKERYADFRFPYRDAACPGIRPLLNWLKEETYILALASSSSEEVIRQMLDALELHGYFSHIISGKMFRESKPNPQIYQYTLSKLGLPAADCLAVEDSTYGIQAAKAAGLQVAAVKDDRFSFDQSQADWFLSKTADLKELLLHM